jgi:hypothetical protein
MSGQRVPLVAGGDPNASAGAVVKLLQTRDKVAQPVADWITDAVRVSKTNMKMRHLMAILVHVPLDIELKLAGDVPPVIVKSSSGWSISDVWKPYIKAPKTVATLNGALVLLLEAAPAVDRGEATVTVRERERGYPTAFRLAYNGEVFVLPVAPVVRHAIWHYLQGRREPLDSSTANAAIQSLAKDIDRDTPVTRALQTFYSQYAQQEKIPYPPEDVAALCVAALADYMVPFATSRSKAVAAFLADNAVTTTMPAEFRRRRRARPSKLFTTGAFADLCV